MLATDRDLLVLEPNLFRDISWAGQRLLETTGSTSGNVLTLAGGDAAAAGVTTGHVALVGGVALEVIERTAPGTLVVSRVRAAGDGPIIPPPTLAAQPVVVTSFAPQLALVTAQALRLVGVGPGTDAGPDGPTESDITDAGALRPLVCLGALHLIYAAASSLAGAGSPAHQRAELYRERFGAERSRASAPIDLDGDGVADVIRRPSVTRLVRG